MLLSMTGHGQGESENKNACIRVSAELRTINNRYFKTTVRSNENSLAIEPKIEALLKKTIRRGTVQVNLRIDREISSDEFKLNIAVLKSYRDQLVENGLMAIESSIESLLPLSGVVQENLSQKPETDVWPEIEKAILVALENLQQMRVQEGASMAVDLSSNCKVIGELLNKIEAFAPQVIESYQNRLLERLNQIAAKHDLEMKSSDIVREVGLFADRCDISEEIVRSRSHLEQFDLIMGDQQSNGRKLDFLTQELFREINTIGSKANDAEIARHVVDIKTAVERIREMIQNAE